MKKKFTRTPLRRDLRVKHDPVSQSEIPGSKLFEHVFTAAPERWSDLRQYVKENRKSQTPAEAVLWQGLRNKKLGFRFRRQHPFDFIIVDFVCIDKRLVMKSMAPSMTVLIRQHGMKLEQSF